MVKIRLHICKRCNKIVLPMSSICDNCLNNIDTVDLDDTQLDIRLVEYTKSMINNKLLGLFEIRFSDRSVRILGEIDKPATKFKVKEWNNKFEFYAI